LDESWIQDTLSEALCQNVVYDENIIRSEVDKIQVFDTFILIFRTDGHRIKEHYRTPEAAISNKVET